MNQQELQQTIHTTIPISQHMGFTIVSLAEQQIEVSAPLPNNINIHGTAFAGSIYTVATLTAWALVYSILQQAGSDAELVLGTAHIKYRAAIKTGLNCQTRISTTDCANFLQKLDQSGRSRIKVSVNINDAAYWEGELFAIRHSGQPAGWYGL